ncbi:hypothetical protein BDW67DRAFT_185742 [Aspergillus spinulosporus]
MFSLLNLAILAFCVALSSSLTVGCYPEDYQIVQNDLFDGLYSLKNDQNRALKPGSCERVVCNSNAAVYWCNDVGPLTVVLLFGRSEKLTLVYLFVQNEDRDAEVKSKQVAEAAWKIIHDCGMSAHTLIYAAGVVIYPTKIRVVVIKDDECLNQD